MVDPDNLWLNRGFNFYKKKSMGLYQSSACNNNNFLGYFH